MLLYELASGSCCHTSPASRSPCRLNDATKVCQVLCAPVHKKSACIQRWNTCLMQTDNIISEQHKTQLKQILKTAQKHVQIFFPQTHAHRTQSATHTRQATQRKRKYQSVGQPDCSPPKRYREAWKFDCRKRVKIVSSKTNNRDSLDPKQLTHTYKTPAWRSHRWRMKGRNAF